MWTIYALLSAVFAASRRIPEKNLSQQLNHFSLALLVQLLSLPTILLVVSLQEDFVNPLTLGTNFWIPLIIISAVFYPLNAYLYIQAIKYNEISNVLPLQSLGPAFAILPAYLFFGEMPSMQAIIGILIIIAGVYFLGLKGKMIHHPFKPFMEDRACRLMLFTVILATSIAPLDKMAIQASNASFYSAASTLGAVVALYITRKLLGVNDRLRNLEQIKGLALAGSLQGLGYTSYLLALAAGPIAYVSAIRSSNILIGSVLGILIFKESITVNKVLSFILILIGGTCLAFS